MRVFVSYAHVDAVGIGNLAKKLVEGGLEPWWDDRLEPGDRWRDELRRRIRACEAFLCGVSPDFVESDWCKWELDQAIALNKFIVPIVLRPGTVLPRAIAGLQYLDLSGTVADQNVASLVDRLVRLKQNGALDESFRSRSPQGSPSRFVQALPRTYRTVAQGYVRPESPGMHRMSWPEASAAGDVADPRVVGIDFGTSTCAVALYERGVARLIPNDLGDPITPSAVAIDLDGTTVVGSQALKFLLRHPERGVVEPKRLLGRDVAKEFGGAVVLEIDGVSYRPVDLAALVLQKLRRDTSVHLGAPIRKAVLAAPAHFDPTQLAALSEAARLAGWDVLRQIAEPVAACMGERRRLAEGSVVLVYDLGGGTFDVSVVEVDAGVWQVRAVNGDTALGGVDLDRIVVDHCIAEFSAATGIDLRGNAAALIRVREAAEEAKVQLSSTRATTIAVPFITSSAAGALHLDVPLTRARYNELTHDLVARTVDLTQKAAEDGSFYDGQTGDMSVLVVGRATRTPSVRAALEDLFGGRLLYAPDHVVASGAAVQAGVLSGEVKDMLLLDVIAHTLRVQVAGDRTLPCVPRHTTIPTRLSVKLAAQNDRQETMVVQVLSGESSWPDLNLPLLRLEVPLGRQAPGAVGRIELTVDLDANGVLSGDASDSRGRRLATGTVKLRQPGTSGHEPRTDSSDLSALLPLPDGGFQGQPLAQASFGQLESVQRWLAQTAIELIRSRMKKTDQLDESSRKTESWLRANASGPIPKEILDWRPFWHFPLERELLVDMMEQRLGLDLRPVRYANSIGTLASRVVGLVRERGGR